MGVKYEVTAVTGKYNDKNGNEKSRYTKLGVVIEGKNGLSLKFESIPVGWDGWAFLNEPRSSEDKPETPKQKPLPHNPDFDEQIPF